jgi:LPS export ABC transporter protein LptC
MKQKWTLVSIALGAMLVFSSTFWFGLTPKQSLVQKSELESAPDFFLEGVETKTFNIDGQLTEKLLAKEIKHYPMQGESHLIEPIVSRTQNGSIWVASSETGLIKDSSNDILLNGSAKITNQSNESVPTVITSNSIIYTDKDQSITSLGKANITSAQGNIKADTITAFTSTNKVTMQGSVRGSYEQNR